jgi:3-oxoacyl-[acyl-carrier protein] reductase
MKSLSGQIALVTGATGGIGEAICRLLASHGCSLAMHYNTDQGAAFKLLGDLDEEYADEIGRKLQKFVVYRADLGNYEEVNLLFDFLLPLLHAIGVGRCCLLFVCAFFFFFGSAVIFLSVCLYACP